MTPGLPACILNDTRVDLHHGCQRVMLALHQLLEQSGFSVAASSPAHSDWTTNPHFIKALEACRLIVVNGEGTIHPNRPAGRKLLEVGAWARSHNIPAVLLNAGCDSNSAAFAQMAKDFSIVSVRVSAGAAALRAHDVVCRVMPDLSLYAGAYAAVIPKWTAALLKGEPVFINGDGETSRDFCYIANTIQTNLLAATVLDRHSHEELRHSRERGNPRQPITPTTPPRPKPNLQRSRRRPHHSQRPLPPAARQSGPPRRAPRLPGPPP